jgi:hypothetical protein
MLEFLASSAIRRASRGQASPGAIGADGFGELLDGLPDGQFSALRAAGAIYVSAPAEDIFEHSMDVFLDGIASQLPDTG